MATETFQNDWTREVEKCRKQRDGLKSIMSRILAAHDTNNNGAVMGEAVLCKMFAELARAAIAEIEGDK